MNFFDLNINIKGKTLKHHKYDEIIKEQTMIAYATHIPISDTDQITEYDRKLILETLKEIKEAESNAYEKALLSNKN